MDNKKLFALLVRTINNIYKLGLLSTLLICKNIKNTYANGDLEELIFKEHISDLQVTIDEGSLVITGQDENFTRVRLIKNNKDCRTSIKIQNKELKIKNRKREGGCACNYEIQLPSSANVEASLGTQKLTFYNLQSSIKFNLGSGDVDINKVNGNISGNVGSGNIHYQPSKSEKTSSFNILLGSGNINCLFPIGTLIKIEPRFDSATSINSSVRQVNDGSQNFIVSGAIGSGVINMSYYK